MNGEQRKKITKIREKVRIKKEKLLAEAAEIPCEMAEGLKEAKVITLYDKEPCSEPGCTHNAVGNGDKCRRHGGERLVRENLLPDEFIPDTVLRGTNFDPAFHPIEFLRLAKEGNNEVEIAALFNISIYTLRGWAEKFESFNTAYEIGQSMYEAWWHQQGKNNLDNRGYNTGLFKYMTMNTLGWSDKNESKNLNVNAGVMIAPAKVDAKSWEEKYGGRDGSEGESE